LYVTKSSDEGRGPRGSKSVVRDKVLLLDSFRKDYG